MSTSILYKSDITNLLLHPEECINDFDLIYVYDHQFDIRREKKGDNFIYVKKNKIIKEDNFLTRIQQLVIPPMWKNVKISSLENGHLQVVGRDAKGRKQYIYHPKWTELRSKTKFLKLEAFGKYLPLIRKKVERDLQQKTWTLTKVLALIVKLLEETHIRIGNQQYAKRNKTYGLTTLRTKHISTKHSNLKIHFIGKRGKKHNITIRNKRLVQLINQCQDIPGWEVFQYYDEYGEKRSIDSSQVNEYIHNISGHNFTAKDFRTWSASLICFNTLCDFGLVSSSKEIKKNIIKSIDRAAKELGNTRSVSKNYYIHPEIIKKYEDGSIQPFFLKINKYKNSKTGLTSSEKAMLSLLKKYTPVIT